MHSFAPFGRRTFPRYEYHLLRNEGQIESSISTYIASEGGKSVRRIFYGFASAVVNFCH